MSSSISTHLLYINSSLSFLLSTIKQIELDEISEDNPIISKLNLITNKVEQIDEEIKGEGRQETIATKIGTLWQNLKISASWHSFAHLCKKRIHTNQDSIHSLYEQGKKIAETIRAISISSTTSLFNTDAIEKTTIEGGHLLEFWNNTGIEADYLQSCISKLRKWVVELQQENHYIDALFLTPFQQRLYAIQKEMNNINIRKAVALEELIKPIIDMTKRILTGIYGDTIKRELVEFSESIMSVEPFLKLLFIDICTFNDQQKITIIPSLSHEGLKRVKEIVRTTNREIEKNIIHGDSNSLDFLSSEFEQLIHTVYQFDREIAAQNIEMKMLQAQIQQHHGENLYEQTNAVEDEEESISQYENTELEEVYESQSIDGGVIDEFIREETKFSTAVLTIIQDILNPNETAILDQVTLFRKYLPADTCVEVIEKLIDVEQQKRYLIYFFVHSIIEHDTSTKIFFQKILEYQPFEKESSFFKSIIKTFLSFEKGAEYILQVALFFKDLPQSKLREVCFFNLLNYVSSKSEEIDFTNDHSLCSLSNVIKVIHDNEFIRFFHDKNILEGYVKISFSEYQFEKNYVLVESKKRINACICSLGLSKHDQLNGIKRAEELIEEKQQLSSELDQFLRELFAPSLSLITYILDGIYGKDLLRRFVCGDMTQQIPKQFFYLLVIHLIRTDQPIPEFSFIDESDKDTFEKMRTNYKAELIDLSNNQIEQLIQSDRLAFDNILGGVIQRLEMHGNAVKKYNAKVSSYLEKCFEFQTCETPSDFPGASTFNLSSIEGEDQKELALDDGLYNPVSNLSLEYYETLKEIQNELVAPPLFYEFILTIMQSCFMDFICMESQLKAIIECNSRFDISQFIHALSSPSLRTKYLAAYLYNQSTEMIKPILLELYSKNPTTSLFQEITDVFIDIIEAALIEIVRKKTYFSHKESGELTKENEGVFDSSWGQKTIAAIDLYQDILATSFKNEIDNSKREVERFIHVSLEKLEEFTAEEEINKVREKLESVHI